MVGFPRGSGLATEKEPWSARAGRVSQGSTFSSATNDQLTDAFCNPLRSLQGHVLLGGGEADVGQGGAARIPVVHHHADRDRVLSVTWSRGRSRARQAPLTLCSTSWTAPDSRPVPHTDPVQSRPSEVPPNGDAPVHSAEHPRAGSYVNRV